MGGKDIAEKALEAYDDVFSDIVNVLLFGGEQLVKEDELTEAAPLSVYKDDGGRLREQERDISKFWKDGRIRICLYGLENQTDIDVDMPLRVISYDGAGYRSQLLADSDNKINVFEIAWLKPETVAKFRSDFRIVADYFVRMRRDKTYEPSRETIRHVHEVLQLMAELTKDRRFAEIQLPPGSAEGGTNMCEVLDRYWNNGLAAGMEKGLAAGMEKGLATGRAEGLIDGIVTSLKNLIANTGMTPAQAMAALGITESERDKYASLLTS